MSDLAVTGRATGELVGEAARLIVGYGCERLGPHRIESEVHGFNSRALRVHEKAGFVVGGVRREADPRDGVWVDRVVTGLLDRDRAALGSPGSLSPRAR
ncbi:GNAT family protein [Streptomyces sp. SID13726]|uniref:GNAT family N-acetyltransferase n=1 Tax=Streptomyces sp. SID13726 TaxID=2706058 RepID=UPI0031BB2C8F